MAAITVHLPAHIVQRLEEEAQRTGRQPSEVAETILVEHLASEVETERDKAIRVLREAGMLSALSDDMIAFAEELRQEANASSLTDEELQAEIEADLKKVGGQPLSEIILEQRGPKV